MAGKAVWTSGKWRILAGSYSTPTLTFGEDDLRSGFTVQSLVSRRENFNCIKGVFVSAQDKYMSVDFPPLISDVFIALDNGEPVYKNITLPFTTSVTMAQRLSKIELLKARQQITLTLPLKLQGLKSNVGDIVYVNNTRMGWSSKAFEVVAMSMSLDEAPGVDLDLREISTDVYDWSTSEEQAYDPAPNTNLPNAFAVGNPTNFTWTQDKFYITGLGSLSWTAATDAFVDFYKLRIVFNPYISGSKTEAQIFEIDREITVYGTNYTITDLPSGYYTAYLTSVNQMGVSATPVVEAIYIPPPPIISRVSGLELDLGENGEAHGNEWTGKDVKIKWRPAAVEKP